MEHNNSYGYLTDCREVPITFPPQHQDRQPGFAYVMDPEPVSECGKACRKPEGRTALITASFSAEEGKTFGAKTSRVPMMRAGQPCEVSPCYVFLASDNASYMTGQVLHPDGGTITGS